MKIYPLLIFLLLYSVFTKAQHWLRKGTGIQISEALDVTTDITGNTYTTGYFSGSITFGAFTLSSAGLSDIFLVKTDSTGNFVWAISPGGGGVDRGYSVSTDNTGNIYITGVFTGSASFGSTVLNSNNASQDIFIAKYNPAGLLQWAKKAGGALGDVANSITTDNFGNIFLTGFFEGVATFESLSITSTFNNVSNQYTADVFTAKYDSNGNIKWVKQGASLEFVKGIDLTTDSDGNVYTTGHFSGNITFDILHPNNSFNAIFVIKYDSTGTEQWFKRIGAGTLNTVSGIASDGNSNIYLTGNFKGGTIIFGTPNITLSNIYAEKIFLIKFNSSGNVSWTKTSGSSSPIDVRDIDVDNAGNPFLTGSFECRFSEFANQYGQGTFNSVGYKDVFVAKYDVNGNWQWARQFGGPKNDIGIAISIDPNNHAIICGNFTGSINFPVNPANFYSPVGDFNPPSVNQNLTYCGDANYGSFAAMLGTGVIDVFITKPVDLSREPYDYYKRSGSGCSRDVVSICIASPDSICLPDSLLIEGCNPSVSLFAFPNTGPGQYYTYLWNNLSTSSVIDVVNTGDYSITISSEDGCNSFADTIHIDVNNWPSPSSTISNSLGLIPVLEPPCAYGSIMVCPPDTQVVLTATTTGVSNSWMGPGMPPQPGLSVTATLEGAYTVISVGANGCIDSTCMVVKFAPPSLDSLVLDLNLPDTIFICEQDTAHIIAYNALYFPACIDLGTAYWSSIPSLSIALDPTCTTKGILSAPSSNGTYQISAMVIRNHPCGGNDTSYVTKSVYIKLNPAPPSFSINIAGDLILCPGTTSTNLTAYGGPPSTIYEWYSLFNGSLIGTSASIIINQPGDYYIIATTINSYGCEKKVQAILYVIVKEAPVIQMNPQSGVVCPGGNVQLSIPVSGGNIQWFGPSGVIGGNTNSISVSIPGTYYCIYIDNDSCELISTSVDVQQYATPFLATGPSTALCPGTIVTIEVVSNSGSAIQWLPPLTGSNPIQTITQPGTYSVMITSCGIQTIDSVTISGSIVEAIIFPSGPILNFCNGDSLTLTSNPGMSSYVWMPGNIQSPNLVIYQSGLYELITSDVNGCTASTSVEVFTYYLDSPQALEDTICKDSSAVLYGYYLMGVLNWFDAPNGNLLDTGTFFTTPALQNTTTFYMQVTDGVCVSSFEPVTVFVNPSPAPPVITSNSPLCEGDTIFLYTNFGNPSTNYFWSGPGSFNSNLQNPVIYNSSSANSGNYDLYYTDDGCPSEIAVINVIVNSIPQHPQIIGDVNYCEGDTINFNTDTIPGANYYWTGPDNFISFSQSVSIPNVSLINSGLYFVSISLGSCDSDTSSVTINIKEKPQAVNASVNSPVCVGDSIILQSVFFNNYNYLWTGPDSFMSNSSLATIHPAELINSGIYILTVELDGCEITENINVNIYEPTPFTLIAEMHACVGEVINVQPDQHFNSYLWSNGESGHQLNLTQTGNYVLTVTNQNGCKSSASVYVEFINCNVDLPNVFTPNNDNFNDVFYLPTEGMVELNCKIYNRWGDLIYEFNDLNGNWDGTHQSTGKECPTGVYFFIAKVIDITIKPKEFSGYVKLIR